MKLKDLIARMVGVARGNMEAEVYVCQEPNYDCVKDVITVHEAEMQRHADDYVIELGNIVIVTGRKED